jgi:hypothetical protein
MTPPETQKDQDKCRKLKGKIRKKRYRFNLSRSN